MIKMKIILDVTRFFGKYRIHGHFGGNGGGQSAKDVQILWGL